MARTNALTITLDGTDADQLAESYGNLIDGITKASVSEQIKNKEYSGDPSTGSVEIDRFANASVNAYGTARTASKGDKLKNSGKVTVNVNQDKEIVEEIANKDVKLYGIGGMAERRVKNHVSKMRAFLDTAFFAEADAVATAVTSTANTVAGAIDDVIAKLVSTRNDWVEGLDRDQIVITVKTGPFSALLREQDFATINEGSTQSGRIGTFHGVTIYENNRQTADIIGMLDGAIAQPVVVDEYAPYAIPLSNDIAIALFFSYGTKAITPDLVVKVATSPAGGAREVAVVTETP